MGYILVTMGLRIYIDINFFSCFDKESLTPKFITLF